MSYDFLSSYEEAFVKLCKFGAKVITESLEKTEKDLGRSMSCKERELFTNLGAAFFALKILDYSNKKGDK